MLPPALTSIYRQYRHDADTVATWLVTTALAHGMNPDRLSTPKNPSPYPSDQRPVLAIKDFSMLAAFLAPIVTSAEITDKFVLALSRLIDTRQAVETRFDDLDDLMHFHDTELCPKKGRFTQALETVRKTLEVVRDFPSSLTRESQGTSLNTWGAIMALDSKEERRALNVPLSAASATMSQPAYQAE